MEIRIKKLHPEAKIPTYSKEGDAGMDLTATSKTVECGFVEYGTGLSVEIPIGYVGLIFPRSSIFKTDQSLCNSVGVIDSGYRGEIKLKFYTMTHWSAAANGYVINDSFGEPYKVGDRIGQIIILPYPTIQFVESDELSETTRGTGGFGSTGK